MKKKEEEIPYQGILYIYGFFLRCIKNELCIISFF